MAITEPVALVAHRLLILLRRHYRPPGLQGSTNPDTATWIILIPPDPDWSGDDSTWSVSIPQPRGGSTVVLVGEQGIRVGHCSPTSFDDLDAVPEWGGLAPWEHPHQSELVAAAVTEHLAWTGAPPFPEDWLDRDVTLPAWMEREVKP